MSTHGLIGIIGGTSWHSTAEYYRHINELVAARLGGHHSARILLSSVDFAQFEALQRAGAWGNIGALLADEARRLERGGARSVLVAANTMHLVAEDIAGAVSIPFLHIADAIATEARAAGAIRIGLLGTRYTMNEPFLIDALAERGIVAVPPAPELREELNRIIYDELCQGTVRDASRTTYLEAIEQLAADGCTAVALACTEIALLITPATPTTVPCIDTTLAHARYAVDQAFA